MKQFIYTLLILSISTAITSCGGDDEPAPQVPTSNELNLNFTFNVGNDPLVLKDEQYILNSEDTISIAQFKFFLSNFKVYNSTGESWLDEDGYYLVKATEGNNTYTLPIDDIPFSEISRVEFYIGLDSAMNFKPLDFPILFQSEGMYWDWNTGYKFLVLEGSYYSTLLGIPGDAIGLVYHIGDMINLNTYDYSFDNNVTLDGNNGLNFDFDLSVIFSSPNMIRLNVPTNRNVMGGPNARLVSENYSEGMINFRGTTE